MRHNANFTRPRSPKPSRTVLALAIIIVVTAIATGIFWLLFRI